MRLLTEMKPLERFKQHFVFYVPLIKLEAFTLARVDISTSQDYQAQLDWLLGYSFC